MILTCTGHRPQKIGGFSIPNPTYNYIWAETEKHLLDLKPDKCITGMALGFDTIFAEVCIKLGIPFISAVPFINQEKIWPKESQDKYNTILKKACEVIIVCEGGYSAKKMQIRNEWMCDNSDLVLACWDESSGGTGNCINYARSIGMKIIIIDPRKANL